MTLLFPMTLASPPPAAPPRPAFGTYGARHCLSLVPSTRFSRDFWQSWRTAGVAVLEAGPSSTPGGYIADVCGSKERCVLITASGTLSGERFERVLVPGCSAWSCSRIQHTWQSRDTATLDRDGWECEEYWPTPVDDDVLPWAGSFERPCSLDWSPLLLTPVWSRRTVIEHANQTIVDVTTFHSTPNCSESGLVAKESVTMTHVAAPGWEQFLADAGSGFPSTRFAQTSVISSEVTVWRQVVADADTAPLSQWMHGESLSLAAVQTLPKVCPSCTKVHPVDPSASYTYDLLNCAEDNGCTQLSKKRLVLTYADHNIRCVSRVGQGPEGLVVPFDCLFRLLETDTSSPINLNFEPSLCLSTVPSSRFSTNFWMTWLSAGLRFVPSRQWESAGNRLDRTFDTPGRYTAMPCPRETDRCVRITASGSLADPYDVTQLEHFEQVLVPGCSTHSCNEIHAAWQTLSGASLYAWSCSEYFPDVTPDENVEGLCATYEMNCVAMTGVPEPFHYKFGNSDLTARQLDFKSFAVATGLSDSWRNVKRNISLSGFVQEQISYHSSVPCTNGNKLYEERTRAWQHNSTKNISGKFFFMTATLLKDVLTTWTPFEKLDQELAGSSCSRQSQMHCLNFSTANTACYSCSGCRGAANHGCRPPWVPGASHDLMQCPRNRNFYGKRCSDYNKGLPDAFLQYSDIDNPKTFGTYLPAQPRFAYADAHMMCDVAWTGNSSADAFHIANCLPRIPGSCAVPPSLPSSTPPPKPYPPPRADKGLVTNDLSDAAAPTDEGLPPGASSSPPDAAAWALPLGIGMCIVACLVSLAFRRGRDRGRRDIPEGPGESMLHNNAEQQQGAGANFLRILLTMASRLQCGRTVQQDELELAPAQAEPTARPRAPGSIDGTAVHQASDGITNTGNIGEQAVVAEKAVVCQAFCPICPIV